MGVDGKRRLFKRQACQILLGLIQVSVNPVLAALALAAFCAQLPRPASLWFWLAVSPLLYFCWLIIYLLLAALETSFVARRFVRPARYHQSKDGWFDFHFATCFVLYSRSFILGSLPLVGLLMQLPLFNRLVLRAYSPRISMGKDVWMAGYILDPDVTIIGTGVVLGAHSRIVAHSMLRTPAGDFFYQSAPVMLGNYCVIGGGAQVEMGAKIGEGAIIEPFSHVLPFTIVPPGEIWGGNPAVFRTRRDRSAAAAAGSGAASPLKNDSAIRQLIADALGLPASEISPESGVSNCPVWDSMGKMAIAAAAQNRFGVDLSPEDIFDLNSVRDVVRAVALNPVQLETGAGEFQLPAHPELIPLFDSARVLATLAKQDETRAESGSGGKVPVIIAATFVAQPLAFALRHYSRAFGLEVEASFYDFNQVPQALLSPESPLRANRKGLNVVLVRPEDLPGNTFAERQAGAAQFIEAIRNFTLTSGGNLLAGDLPPVISPGRREFPSEMLQLQGWWRRELAAIAGLEILDFADIIANVGKLAARDVPMERAASAPYSPSVYRQLGINITRALRKRCLPPRKVLALDCDNTLWGGIIGEDGFAGIQLGEDATGRGFRAFQSEVLALKERGVLLVLVSKNLAEDVWNVVDHHPGMILRRKDFAAAKINWQPKPDNLRQLAKELNLGLDSFVFVDDNPVERLEVEAHCPQVAVVPLPPQPEQFAETLSRLWLFDGAGDTNEDRTRNDFLQQENARRGFHQSAGDLQSYLASLALKVRVRGAAENDLPRVVQLLQRTNQFNLSLQRRTLAEVQALLPNHDLRIMTACDRFGDFGLVGICISRQQADAVFLDSFLISCRALGRGMEEAFLHAIARSANTEGAKFLRGRFAEGPRNQPMKHFLKKTGFREVTVGMYELEADLVPPAPPWIDLAIDDDKTAGNWLDPSVLDTRTALRPDLVK
ncbi:MAG TPA: HAD-IIIC family phosphatase [Candidatus Limnocylindrales bacterium]|nr:HAD-IIIC family phosphatase [Candidatus Limnocylindrales bacterium]